jgi:hypothetical protein
MTAVPLSTRKLGWWVVEHSVVLIRIKIGDLLIGGSSGFARVSIKRRGCFIIII